MKHKTTLLWKIHGKERLVDQREGSCYGLQQLIRGVVGLCCLVCSTVVKYISLVVMCSCVPNSNVCTGLQYAHNVASENDHEAHLGM